MVFHEGHHVLLPLNNVLNAINLLLHKKNLLLTTSNALKAKLSVAKGPNPDFPPHSRPSSA